MSTELRVLHVAALPFPTSQGTQALIDRMLQAQHDHGRAVELLCYAHGAQAFAGSYTVRRAHSRLLRGRSLRSGPSLEKIALDVGLQRALRQRLSAFRPDVLVAHHVEAALLALCTSSVPVVYVAHTSLAAELPVYLPGTLAGPAGWAGAHFERVLCRRAAAALAVSPLLSDMLTRASGVAVPSFVLPWPVPEKIAEAERAVARESLGIPADQLVLLYAGNLDAYQGLDAWFPALARLARLAPFTWLVASEAKPSELEQALRGYPALRRHIRLLPLAGEHARRTVHAAADVALVPRRSPGGVPIKLFDALSRGVPVIANQRACAGTELAQFCQVVRDDDEGQLFRALHSFGVEPSSSHQERSELARSYLREQHSPARFLRSFEAHLAASR